VIRRIPEDVPHRRNSCSRFQLSLGLRLDPGSAYLHRPRLLHYFRREIREVFSLLHLNFLTNISEVLLCKSGRLEFTHRIPHPFLGLHPTL
jgi:hypothetical protein